MHILIVGAGHPHPADGEGQQQRGGNGSARAVIERHPSARATATHSSMTCCFMRVIDEVFGQSHTIVSMRQDLDRGRKTEIDFMNGAVADLGDRYGVPCPVNRAFATMIRYLERQP